MPLIKTKSKQAFKSNVSEMVKAGHPIKQALAAAYNIKEKHASGGLMNNDRMMSDLMKRRKAKMMAEGGEAYDYDLMDQDDEPSLHERPSSAKMNNQDPNLQEQSRYDMGDNEDSEMDHKLSAEGRPSEREEALYAEGGPAIDPDKAQSAQDSMRKAFKYAKGGNVKMAYGQGRKEIDQEDTKQLRDESSAIAMAKGGIAYNQSLKENYQDDTPEDKDEASRIAMAAGGNIAYTDTPEYDQEDTPQSHDESSEYAQGGTVEGAEHLEDNDTDTEESKDEASSIAMARGGVAYNNGLTEEESDDTDLLHNEEQYADGGQVNNDQSSRMNPKAMENEDEQEQAMKARRRRLMISALNE